MEIVPLDLSILAISFVLASAILAFYFRPVKFYKFNRNNANEGFPVIDIIRTLKKSCPLQFNNKWKLLFLSQGTTRCWYKNVLFPVFKNYVKLYGATCAVTCSSVYAFSLISDVSKWGEWEPSQSSQNLLLQPFNNKKFKRDHFMQSHQIVGIQRGTDIQSYIAMYRFLSSPSKCTKWILFWNAKKFEFMFFLIQPVTSRDADNHCVITHLYGSSPLSPHSPELVAQRIRNIKEFLSLSQLNVRPLAHSTISTPLPLDQSALKNEFFGSGDPSSVFLDSDSCDTSNSIFILVPLFHYVMFSFKRLKGYNLILKKVAVKTHLKKPKIKINPTKNNLLRRSVSDLTITTKTNKDFHNSSLNLSSEISSKFNSLVPEIILRNLNENVNEAVSEDAEVLQSDKVSDSQKGDKSEPVSPRPKLRSFSVPSVTIAEKSTLQSEITSDEDIQKSLQSISEIEESMLDDNHDKNELFCSSTSEFEMVDVANQQFIDTAMAGYLTQGNYGASVLQTEMLLACQFDKSMHSGNRVAGGWIHTSTYKGIPVLTKSISGKIMKIISFLCQIEIPVNYKDVWKCVKNPRFRFFSDETVKTVQIIDKISNSQKLIHVYHETSGVLRKEAIDFCLLQTEREEKKHFYSVFQSIEYEKCPLMQSVVRGSLKPSGWIVQNLTPKKCKVTYLIQIFVNSSDNLYIQELGYLVPQSLYSVKQFLTSRPK